MRWGKDNEETVRKLYADNRAAEGENMIVTHSGLYLMADKSYLGASPDRLHDGCMTRVIHVACKYMVYVYIGRSIYPTIDIDIQLVT